MKKMDIYQTGLASDPFGLAKTPDAKFEEVLKYGWYVIHIQGNYRYPCSCVNSNGEPDPFCLSCYGVGSAITIKKELVRNTFAVMNRMWANLDAPAQVGNIENASFGYYMRYTAYPSTNDLLIECDWDTNTNLVAKYGRPTKVNKVFEVTDTYQNRIPEPVYTIAAVRVKEFNLDWYEKIVLSLGSRIQNG